MDIYAKCLHPYVNPQGIAYGCGQCPNCKKSKSLEWSIRARHELITSKKAVFITLTYNNKNLKREAAKAENRFDRRGVLCQEDVQKFMKRLRKYYKQRTLRYFYCGEYGEKKWRPHYHMILFGVDYTEVTEEGIGNIWTHGKADVSQQFVTDNAISYIVGYVKKKIPGRTQAYEKYEGNNRPKPYLRASQGLGGEWSDIHIDEWSRTLEIAYKGYQVPVPRYYIKRAKKREGITIKHNTITEKIGGNTEVRRDYKIIENPHGFYTKRINQVELDKQYLAYSKWMDRYKIKEEEVAQIIDKSIDIKQKRIINNLLKWDFSKTMTEDELSKFYENYIYKRNIVREGSIDGPKLISNTVAKRLYGIAKRKAYEYTHGIYGKRDTLEIMEDIEGIS